MSVINWGRVILGGLLAGLILNITEALGGMLFWKDWEAALQKLGTRVDDPASTVMDVGSMFLYGCFAAWLYAAIRPRFGPGPRTALRAAVGAWFAGNLLSGLGYASLGILPIKLIASWVTISLVGFTLATLAGAWLYKESSPSVSAAKD